VEWSLRLTASRPAQFAAAETSGRAAAPSQPRVRPLGARNLSPKQLVQEPDDRRFSFGADGADRGRIESEQTAGVGLQAQPPLRLHRGPGCCIAMPAEHEPGNHRTARQRRAACTPYASLGTGKGVGSEKAPSPLAGPRCDASRLCLVAGSCGRRRRQGGFPSHDGPARFHHIGAEAVDLDANPFRAALRHVSSTSAT
jgi:hypothetical protein